MKIAAIISPMLASDLPEECMCVIMSLMARESATVSKGSTASCKEGIVLSICATIPFSSSFKLASKSVKISAPASDRTIHKKRCSTVKYSCLFSFAYATAFLNTSLSAKLIISILSNYLLQWLPITETDLTLLFASPVALLSVRSQNYRHLQSLYLFHVSET